jgi:hypothetical protein
MSDVKLDNSGRKGGYTYLKDKINGLQTNSKDKNIKEFCRGTSEFRNSYQLRYW